MTWTAEDYQAPERDESGTRFMRRTPLCSDGEFIYALAAYRTDTHSSTMKRIVCEVYNLVEKVLSKVSEFELKKPNGEDPYRGSKRYYRDYGGFLSHINIACNGTVLLVSTPEKIHVFSTSDGKRIKTHATSQHLRWFCSKKNLLFYSDRNSSYSFLRHWEVEGFK